MRTPLSLRISSALGVVGLFAPSTTMRQRMRVGVLGVDHAAERRRDEDVALERDELVRVDLLGAAVELAHRAALANVLGELVGVDAVLGAAIAPCASATPTIFAPSSCISRAAQAPTLPKPCITKVASPGSMPDL